MRTFLAAGFVVLSVSCLGGSMEKIDSLYQAVKKERSLSMARELLPLAEKEQDPAALAKVHFLIGYYENEQKMYYEAMNSYFSALKFYRKSENITRQYLTMINIALIYEKANFINEALSIYEDARLLAELEEDSLSVGRIDYFKARLYRISEEYTLAKSLFNDALKRFKLLSNSYMINEIHAEMGVLAENQGDLDLARQFHSITVLPDIDGSFDPYAQARQLINMSYNVLNQTSQIDSVQSMLYNAIEIVKLIKPKADADYLFSKIYGNLARSYELAQKPDSVVKMYELSLTYLDKRDFSLSYLQKTKKVSDYYRALDPEKAAHYQQEIYAFAEELANLQQKLRDSFIRYQVEAANYKHESEERREAQLRQEYLSKTIYTAFVVFILTAAALLGIQRYRKRERARKLLKKFKAI